MFTVDKLVHETEKSLNIAKFSLDTLKKKLFIVFIE